MNQDKDIEDKAMANVSKMEELEYTLNFCDDSDPLNRFELQITFERSIELTKMFMKLYPTMKGVFNNGWLRMWVTASLPINKSAIQNL